MKNKILFKAILGVVCIMLASLLTYFIVDSRTLKAGMSKEEAKKVLKNKYGKLNEGKMEAILANPQKTKLEIISYTKYKIGEMVDISKEEKENVINNMITLCFEDGKVVRWGFGRGGLIEILKGYPGLSEIFTGSFGGFVAASPKGRKAEKN
jgi:uncharacterized membrane protein YraQ (UPF0718 family)